MAHSPAPHDHLHEVIAQKARTDGSFAIAYGLLRLADAQENTATQLKNLGNADAATPMGAIEGLGALLGNRLTALTDAIRDRDD